MSKIVNNQRKVLSPWVTLNTKSVDWEDGRGLEVYHSFDQADYVSMLAITEDGRVPLIHQYRTGCEGYTTELPGGMLESGETPEQCARRELFEETGLVAGYVKYLTQLWPDPSRLGNALHCFLITGAKVSQQIWNPENGLHLEFVEMNKLYNLIADGYLDNAHHVAIIGLVMSEQLAKKTELEL